MSNNPAPPKARIARKSAVWSRIKNGQLMNCVMDLETGGIGRQGVPYATPKGNILIHEIGMCITDLAGNLPEDPLYQILLRRPEDRNFDPAAALISRIQNLGPELFDEEGRMEYGTGMAASVWLGEQSAFDYPKIAEKFGYKKKPVSFIDINKQLKDGHAHADEDVYEIPLLDDNGEVVYDVRYHPDKRMVAYRFTRDGRNWKSPEYSGHDNLYYKDKKDDSIWKFVTPRPLFSGYNWLRYDNAVYRDNLYEVGFSSANSTLMYARGTPTSTQRLAPTVCDVRDRAYLQHLFGNQGDEGLDLGEIIDTATGHIRPSESLMAYIEKNMTFGNAIRLQRPGPLDPHDHRSFIDPKLAHGAVADALATVALMNFCDDLDPWLSDIYARQRDRQRLTDYLSAKSPNGDTLPLFSMPVRMGGRFHSELPYWFVGTDEQAGDMREMIFFRADGNFHKERFEGKLIRDLSIDEMMRFLKSLQENHDPFAPIRFVSKNKFQGALSVKDVFQQSTQAKLYRDRIDDMKDDCRYFLENPEMAERIIQALGYINYERRFHRTLPQNPYPEDSLPQRFAGEVSYLQEERAAERREIFEGLSMYGNGAKKLSGILETINAGMNNDHGSFMNPIDEAMGQLSLLTPHVVDMYRDHDFKDSLDPNDLFGAKALEDFTKLAERLRKKFKEKEWPYQDVLDSIINPSTQEPYLKGNKFRADTPQQAFRFRMELGKRMLQALHTLINKQKLTPQEKEYIEDGYVSMESCHFKHKGVTLPVFFDADNGQSGRTPHVVDEHRGKIPLRILKGLNRHIDFRHGTSQAMEEILDNLVNKGRWNYRFHKDPSEPGWHRLAKRFVGLGLQNHLPENIRIMLDADFVNRKAGMANETETTDRITTLRTMKRDYEDLLIAGSQKDHMLERHPNPLMSLAAAALKHDEARQRLAWIGKWIEREFEKLKGVQERLAGYMPEAPAARRTHEESGLVYDRAPHVIPRRSWLPFEDDESFLYTDVPIRHLHHSNGENSCRIAQPIEQEDNRFRRQLLIVPNLKASFVNAVNNGKRPVIVRCFETGEMYAAAYPNLVKFPRGDTSMQLLEERTLADYKRSGINLDEKDKLWVLGMSELVPLAHTRELDPDVQGIKLPHAQFVALQAPEFVGQDTRLTSAIYPTDYLPARIIPGERIRLRQMLADSFDNLRGDTDEPETGMTFETDVIMPDDKELLRKIGFDENGNKVGVSRLEFERMAAASEIPENWIKGANILGGSIDHLREHLDRLTTGRGDMDPNNFKLVLLPWEEVNRDYRANGRRQEFNTYAFDHPYEAPRAEMWKDGIKPGPTASRHAKLIVE